MIPSRLPRAGPMPPFGGPITTALGKAAESVPTAAAAAALRSQPAAAVTASQGDSESPP